jgi:hypothetical protein
MSLPTAQAEVSIHPVWLTAIIALAGLAGPAIAWAWGEWRKARLSTAQSAERREGTYVAQLEGYIERLEADRQGMLADARKRESDCDRAFGLVADTRVLVERCIGHIRYLETVLDERKIPYRKWDQAPDPKPAGPAAPEVT